MMRLSTRTFKPNINSRSDRPSRDVSRPAHQDADLAILPRARGHLVTPGHRRVGRSDQGSDHRGHVIVALAEEGEAAKAGSQIGEGVLEP